MGSSAGHNEPARGHSRGHGAQARDEMSRSNNPWGGKLKMTEDTQKKRDPIWVYVAVALLLLAGFVWYSVDREPQARPPGTHEDLATLA